MAAVRHVVFVGRLLRPPTMTNWRSLSLLSTSQPCKMCCFKILVAFVFEVRIMTKEHERITLFLGVHEPDARGADGLMESFLAVKDNVKFPLSKLGLYGITTEGANTGKEAGLWKKLSDYLERNIFTVWCVAHRS